MSVLRRALRAEPPAEGRAIVARLRAGRETRGEPWPPPVDLDDDQDDDDDERTSP